MNNEIVSESWLKTFIAVLAGIFYVKPELVAILIVLYTLNAVAKLWMLFLGRCKNSFKEVVVELVTRFLVYTFALAGAVALSKMGAILAWINSFMFGAIGTWELLLLLNSLGQIYPPFQNIYYKLNIMLQKRTDYVTPDRVDDIEENSK